MTAKQELMKRSSAMIGKLRSRIKEKISSAGRVTRPGRELPFTLPQLRDWLIAKSEVRQGTAWVCTYCKCRLSIVEVELDHKVPLSRGGGVDLDNLTPSCKTDNKTKGELTDDEYVSFREGLRTFPQAAEAYILKCMRTAGIGFQFHRSKIKPLQGEQESEA